MKTIKTILLLVVTINLSAQIPNAGFENWVDMGTYNNPESWGTLNNKWASSTIFTATEGPGYSGTSCLKLTSKTIGPLVRNGTAVSGILDSMNVVPISGFAFTGQPAAFSGQWQHMIFGSSQGHVTVVLTKWNSSLNVRDTIAVATKTLEGMAMSWESFSIPFEYTNLTAPDSCIIFLQASGQFPAVDDYLWVDDLSFTGVVAGGIIDDEERINLISVYPNPTNGHLVKINFDVEKDSFVNVKIVDVFGKLVFSSIHEIHDNQVMINLESVANGVYILQIEYGDVVYKEKIIRN